MIDDIQISQPFDDSCSRIDMGENTCCYEYNSTNAWNYNGNNGILNNNNKSNGYRVRPVLDFDYGNDNLESYLIPLHDWYSIALKCREHKRTKPSQLLFEYNFVHSLLPIVQEVNLSEFVPRPPICFIITHPRTREVIAADYSDRIVQTYFCGQLIPLLERYHYNPSSYACRVGKGSIRAVWKFRDCIQDEVRREGDDTWIASFDLYNFFMSINVLLAVDMLSDFIRAHFDDGPKRDTLLYLARVLYQSLPQEHCIMKSPSYMWDDLPSRKSLLHKEDYRGTAIGNLHSQMMASFLTTFILNLLNSMGYKALMLYSDDCYVVIHNKRQWQADLTVLEHYCATYLHLTIHPHKKYMQHWTKGCNLLGMRIKGDIITPSKRIVHDLQWLVERETRYAIEAHNTDLYLFVHAETFMARINSYLGLLKWTSSYRLRKKTLDNVKNSVWGKIYIYI